MDLGSRFVFILLIAATIPAVAHEPVESDTKKPMRMGRFGSEQPAPELDDPDSNLPMVDLVSPTAPAPSPLKSKVAAKPTQPCDPELDAKIFRQLSDKVCKRSRTASCPMDINDFLRKHATETGAIAGGILGNLQYSVTSFFEAKDMENQMAQGQSATQLVTAKEGVKSLGAADKFAGDAGVQEFVGNATHAPNPKAFTRLANDFIKLNPEHELSVELKAIVAMFPPNKSIRKMMTSMLIGGVVGRTFGTAAGALNGLSNTEPTGCDEAGSQWISESPEDNCKPKYAVNDHVIRFLNLSHNEKAKILSQNPNVCEFYTKFNELLEHQMSSTPVHNVRCGFRSASFDAPAADGGMLRFTTESTPDGHPRHLSVARSPQVTQTATRIGDFSVDFVDENKIPMIRQVNYQKINLGGKADRDAATASWNQLMDDHAPDGIFKNYYKPVITTALAVSKVYSAFATTCCALEDESKRKDCIAKIEKPAQKSIFEQRQSIYPPPASPGEADAKSTK